MPNITFIRPESDPVEQALSSWASLVIASIPGSTALTLNELRGSSVTRTAVERELRSNNTIIYFGHGLKDRLGVPTSFVDSSNVAGATGQIMVGVACKAGAKLADDAIMLGVRAFLGFNDELVVYLSPPALFGQVVKHALTPFLLAMSNVSDLRDALVSGFQSIETIYRDPLNAHPDAEIIWLAAHINWRGVSSSGDQAATL